MEVLNIGQTSQQSYGYTQFKSELLWINIGHTLSLSPLETTVEPLSAIQNP